jgi:hypothetical protein
MDVRSDPAGTLHEMLGVPGIAPLQNHFDAPEHLPGAPGVDDLASGHLDFDPEVTLDTGYRINDNSLSHMISSLSDSELRMFVSDIPIPDATAPGRTE